MANKNIFQSLEIVYQIVNDLYGEIVKQFLDAVKEGSTVEYPFVLSRSTG